MQLTPHLPLLAFGYGPPQPQPQLQQQNSYSYQQYPQQPYAQQTSSPAAQSQEPYTAQQQPYPAQVQVQPQGTPSFPPSSSPTRHVTEPGVAGLGAGDQQAWDPYYQQHGQQPPQPSQSPSQSQPQHPSHSQSQPQQGSYYPAQAQAQGYQAAYATMPDGRAYAPPHPPGTHQGQGVEGVTAGMDRMNVHAP